MMIDGKWISGRRRKNAHEEENFFEHKIKLKKKKRRKRNISLEN